MLGSDVDRTARQEPIQTRKRKLLFAPRHDFFSLDAGAEVALCVAHSPQSQHFAQGDAF